MTVPVISKHAREIGTSPTVAGLIGSVYGFLQLFTCPFVGRWSDVSGRRQVLAWCLLFSTVGYALLGIAGSVVLLIIARIPAGIFKHSQELSKAYLADVMPRSQRSHVFGRFNSISNIGFIIGPIIGGYVVDHLGGFHVVAVLTASIFMLNFVLVQAALRVADSELHQTRLTVDQALPSSSNHHHTLHRNENEEVLPAKTECVDWRSVWEIMSAQFLLGSAMLVYRADFAVTVSQRYGTSNTINGYISALSSIVGTLTGFSVGHIADIYVGNTRRLFLHAAIAESVSLLAIANAPTLMLFTTGHAALAFATSVSRVASIQTILAHSSQQHTGTLIGSVATVMSVARMLAPTASGVSQEVFSCYGPAILSAALSLAGTIVLLIMPSKADIKTHAA